MRFIHFVDCVNIWKIPQVKKNVNTEISWSSIFFFSPPLVWFQTRWPQIQRLHFSRFSKIGLFHHFEVWDRMLLVRNLQKALLTLICFLIQTSPTPQIPAAIHPSKSQTTTFKSFWSVRKKLSKCVAPRSYWFEIAKNALSDVSCWSQKVFLRQNLVGLFFRDPWQKQTVKE